MNSYTYNLIKKTVITDWKNILTDEINVKSHLTECYFETSKLFESKEEYYPEINNIFRSFNFFNFKDTKVIIIGQDPYYNISKKTGIPLADGLAFSFNKNAQEKVKNSLRNIFKEIMLENNILNYNLADYESSMDYLAKQGVLLINNIMTVSPGKALSHKKKYYWEKFTDFIITCIDTYLTGVSFILMGKEAQKKEDLINNNNVISVGHPSPINKKKNFIGSGCFLKADPDINWIPNKIDFDNNKKK